MTIVVTAPAEAVLAVQDLTVEFALGNRAAVAARNLCFSIAPGRTLGLVGQSGSGKSITALSILGLQPPGARLATCGSIRLNGRELHGAPETVLRGVRGGQVGIVFQEPMSCLNPLMAVGRQVAEAVSAHRRLAGAAMRRHVLRLFEEVSLPQPARSYDAYPHELSGGQQQRVMIAMALAGDPLLLVADEPTTALDRTVQAQILALLRNLQRNRAMAMLFISHDIDVVSRMADDLAVLWRGEIVEQGPVEAVFARPEHSYTRALLASRIANVAPRARLSVLTEPLAGGGRGDGRESSSPGVSLDVAPTRCSIGARVLAVEGLCVDYPSRRPFTRSFRAVAEASMTLHAGETLGIVGESGSGKSTLAKAILGLVRPAAGRLLLFGDDPERLGPAARRSLRQRCQLVFQNATAALNPRLRVETILREPLEVHGLAANHGCRDRLAVLLTEVGLDGTHLARYPHQMSGGQRQRIAIARALTLNPEILVCDEIVSALDMSTQAQILNLLLDIQETRGLAILFISHDLAVVRHVADRVAVMKDGRIVEEGASTEIFSAPRHPYTKLLLSD